MIRHQAYKKIFKKKYKTHIKVRWKEKHERKPKKKKNVVIEDKTNNTQIEAIEDINWIGVLAL